MIQGTDVSKHQGRVDWTQVRRWAAFAWARASLGASYADPTFAANLAGARDAGVIVGAYHVLRWDSPGADQAKRLRDLHADYRPGVDLPPSLDVEWIEGLALDARVHREARAFVDACPSLFGCVPVIYTAASFCAGVIPIDSPLGACDLWVADYRGKAEPARPMAWKAWRVWQGRGDAPPMPGIATKTDRNVFAGDDAALRAWVASYGPSRVGPAEVPRAESTTAPIQLSVLDAASDWREVP